MGVPEPLRFPRGVRFPRKNELPRGHGDLLRRVAVANITTGYRVEVAESAGPYTHFFEANIHADQIFEVFEKLAFSLMPDIAAPLIGLKEEEPTLGPYTCLEEALNILRPHREVLQHDGFLEFGIMFQHDGWLEEIFVKSPKYFQIWTNAHDSVVNVFREFRILQVGGLEFIDQYPMVSKSVDAKGTAVWPGVFEAVREGFGNLPRALPEQ